MLHPPWDFQFSRYPSASREVANFQTVLLRRSGELLGWLVTHIAQLNPVVIELSYTAHTANFGAWNIRAGTNARVHTHALSLSTRSSQTLMCSDDWIGVLACNTYGICECRPLTFCTDTIWSVCHNCRCVKKAVKTLTRRNVRVRTAVSLTRRSSSASVVRVSTSLPCLHRLMTLGATGR
jgi:hypothetical protein